MVRLALLLPPMALAGCVTATEARSYSAKEVSENLIEWHGRTVFVSGYVSGCEPYSSCYLVEGPRDSVDYAFLSLGGDVDFKEMLAKAQGYKVLIEAEVDATCHIGNVICMGNSRELKPNRLIRAY